jgi:hypothetical protein
MAGLDKILDDAYSYLKARRWGLPLVAIGLMSFLLFEVWNSLPTSTKETLFGQPPSLPLDDENLGTGAANILLPAQPTALSARLTGTATAHVSNGGWMKIEIFVNNESKPCTTANVYKNSTSENILSATGTCDLRLMANVPYSFYLKETNYNADARAAKLTAQYRR